MKFPWLKKIKLLISKKTRGLAFIEFEDKDDALEAIENLDQAELFGKVIACYIFIKRQEASTI